MLSTEESTVNFGFGGSFPVQCITIKVCILINGHAQTFRKWMKRIQQTMDL